MLDLQIILYAVFGTFAPKPRLFYPAERRDFIGEHAGVDADHARLQCFADAEHATYIARIKICGEAELAVVGKLDRLGFRMEADQRGNRPEGFLLGYRRGIARTAHHLY